MSRSPSAPLAPIYNERINKFEYDATHFAATLLECGPHVAQEHPRLRGDYRDRVYSYFFTLFPGYGYIPQSVKEGPEHEWSVFWREYREWVEGRPTPWGE